jgi:hypothetical protein
MRWASLLLGMTLAAQEPEGMIRFGTTVVMPDGLRGRIYFMKDSWSSLPDFRKLKARGTIYTTSLNVPPQNFELGFPGVTRRFEWFAIDYTGRFWVKNPGVYRFHLLSDDGSRLWIDGRLVVDNDGIHAPRLMHGEIELSEGPHRIEVAYFQGPRAGVALVLSVSRPGESSRVFHVDDFQPPPGTEILVEKK